MRIALFSETTLVSHNGVATRLHATLTELAHLGDEAILVVPGVPGLPARYAGARVVGLPSLPLPLYPGLSFGLPWMGVPARRVLTAFQPEIVHALDPISGVGRAALRTAARQQVPLVVSFNTDLPQYTRHYVRGLESLTWAAVRGMHRQADLRLCPSRAVQKRLAVHGIQAHVWTSGVDARRFAPHHRSGAWRRRLTAGGSLAEHTVILLSVGRLAAEKGLPLLLATLPHVLARTTVPVHVAIVGGGPQEALLRKLARGLPVTFLGSLDGEDLAAAYAS